MPDMSEQEIENRDQEVVNKFRSIVHAKSGEKKKKNAYVAVLSGIGLVAGISLLAFYLSLSEGPPSEMVKHHSARIALDADRSPTASPPLDQQLDQTEAVEKKPVTDDAITRKTQPPPDESDRASPSDSDAPRASGPPEKSAAPEIQLAAKAAEPEKKALDGIRIARLVTCRKVENKQCVSATTEFSIRDDNRPEVWAWMDVRSKESRLPYLLRHTYYFNDQKYAAVVLEVKYPRMRTWSNITLDHEKYAGNWRVEVLTADKEKIAETEFQVVP
jgi:hypothetical protein